MAKQSQGFTKEQREEMDAHNATQKTLNDNSSILANYSPLNNVHSRHNKNLQNVQKAVQGKTQSTVAFTELKDNSRNEIEKKYKIIVSITSDYGIEFNDPTLVKQLKIQYQDLVDVSDVNFYTAVKNINDTITPLLLIADFKDYKITASLLAEGLANAQKFADLLVSNADLANTITLATDKIEALMIPLRDDFKSIKRTIEYFNPDFGLEPNADFYNAVTKAVTIKHEPHSRTTLEGHVYIMGTKIGLEKVEVKIIQNGKLDFTDLVGEYKIESFLGGTYQVTFTLAGYKQVTKIITIKRSEKLIVDVELEPII